MISEVGVGDCPGGIDADAHDDAHGAANGVARALRNVGHIAAENIATGRDC